MADIETLLFKGESETLDFKRDQYPFVNASSEAKAKLLKDILAMANAWRDAPAQIIIGVDVESDPNPQVVGITQHLDDANLQQFVNEKTNRAIKFNYVETKLREKSVGVIEIPVQTRPFYLRKDFGNLRANVVYVRRGSSNMEATPDEVMLLGGKSVVGDDEIRVEFADADKRTTLGREISISCSSVALDNDDEIPDYEPDSGYLVPRIGFHNKDYYRELVDYVVGRNLMRKIAITATNTSNMRAQSIRLELVVPDPRRDWEFADIYHYLDTPPEEDSFGHAIRRIKPAAAKFEPECEIEYSNGNWHLNFEIRDLQPQRTLKPGIEFYAGCRRSANITITGRIFAAELPKGSTCELKLEAQAKSIQIDLETIVEKPNVLF